MKDPLKHLVPVTFPHMKLLKDNNQYYLYLKIMNQKLVWPISNYCGCVIKYNTLQMFVVS
ncbi:hypothetical protein H8356DRAFT_972487 [Neocallimastix lanati (nom. inval.)]|uniref:Uncharacterized protein n=1 Tax=Neocallimastix californiae TaxID=1754190 RepID=A0A1Y2CXI6_9FUNG|nr:hypothetical protein H8356DRAFT_972487 [Neocallimastix sp. JGI-2020a]ORY51748.1 hypothetical protein LY90DRAFT_702807 [Neocallimastix californiae]|eukprot:ORY51748.1 hypothetical protein LY90DRAFT_702807 [Neocallimastix californiae]